jgi:hypothetical protein
LNNLPPSCAKQREQQERERKEYRDRFWSKAQNTPTRPNAPLK